jgi:mercuric ion transport protein
MSEMDVDHPSTPSSQSAGSCSCGKAVHGGKRVVKWTTAGGLLASLGVCAACCLLPFALLSVGVAGAWVSALDALAPYKWILMLTTVILLAYGFYAVYWKPRSRCAAGAACDVCGSDRSIRIGLWIATILAIAGIVFEYFEPLLTHRPM